MQSWECVWQIDSEKNLSLTVGEIVPSPRPEVQNYYITIMTNASDMHSSSDLKNSNCVEDRRSSVVYGDVYLPDCCNSSYCYTAYLKKHYVEVLLSADQRFWLRCYQNVVIPAFTARGEIMDSLIQLRMSGCFTEDYKLLTGYRHGYHTVIGLMHDVELNPGPVMSVCDDDLMVPFSEYCNKDLLREKFLTMLQDSMPSESFDKFMDIYTTTPTTTETVKCKCFVCELRGDESPWLHSYPPRRIHYVLQAQIVFKYVLHMAQTHNKTFTTYTLNMLVASLITHGLSYSDCSKLKESKIVAMMDSFVDKMFFGGGIKEANKNASELVEALEEVKETGVSVPEMGQLAEVLEAIKDEGVKIPSMDRMADVLEAGVKVETNIFSSFLGKLSGFLDPFIKVINDMKDAVLESSPIGRTATTVFVMACVEYFRSRVSRDNKYNSALCVLNLYLAYRTGNTCIFSSALGYYGVNLATNIYTIIRQYCDSTYDSDEDGPELQAFSDYDPEAMKKTYLEMMLHALTGIKDSITIKNAIMTFGLYKTFVTAASFTIDSITDMTLRICNWLGSDLGIKFFKMTYNKYPALYTIQEDLNYIQDKVIKAEPFELTDTAKFMAILDILRVAQRGIAVCSQNGVYLTMLRHLEDKWNKLNIILKCKGIISAGLVPTAFVIGLVGPPHVGKAQILTKSIEILLENNTSPEFYEEFKRNRNRYWYVWKKQKFADSFSSECRVVILDDLGAVKKASTSDSCEYVWWIAKVNNIPDKVDKSAVGEKDMCEFKPEFIGWTSNDSYLDDNKMWATRPEAVYRRMTNGSGSSWYIRVKEQYRIKDASSNWGYRVNKSMLKFDKLNIDTFEVVEYDMELGENLHDSGSPSPCGKVYNWREWLIHLDACFKMHKTRESNLLANNSEIEFDPYYNPFKEGPVAKMETMKEVFEKITNTKDSVASYAKDPSTQWDEVLREALIKEGVKIGSLPETFDELNELDLTNVSTEVQGMLLMHIRKCKDNATVDKLKDLKDYDTFDDYVEDLWKFYKQRQKAHRTFNCHEFVSWHATLVYGSVGDEEWAKFATANYKQMEPIYRAISEACSGLVSAGFLQRVDNFVNIWKCERSFKGYTCLLVDLAYKFRKLCKLWELSVVQVWKVITQSKVSIKQLVHDTFNVISRACLHTFLIADDASRSIYGSVFHFNNMWVSAFVGGLLAMSMAAKTAHNVAMSDYNRRIKVLVNPLTKKCKFTNMKVKSCDCDSCKEIKTKYYEGIKKQTNVAKSAIDGDALRNLKDMSMSVAKRNCWNLQFIMPDVSNKPVINNNGLAACTQIILIPDHFIHNCDMTRSKLPGPAILRFVNYKGSRSYDVNFNDMMKSMLRYPDRDLAVWVNRSYSSFGGGIRNIISFFPYEDEPKPIVGYQYLSRYNKEDQCVETSDLMNVKIGKQRVDYVAVLTDNSVKKYTVNVYTSNIGSVHGNCGCPLFSADDRMKEQKIVGIIVAGDTDGSITFCTGVTRNFLEGIIEDLDLLVFDTSDLPTNVKETDMVNEAFCASDIKIDNHPMPTHNTITKTALHGLFGEAEKIPCFISVVDDPEKGAYCVQTKTRNKYATNGPPCSDILLRHAVQMVVKDLESGIPDTEERFYKLTKEEAINGAKGEAPLSTKTSAGAKYLLQDVTKKMIVKRNVDELDLSSEWGQQFLKDIDYKVECYKKGKIPLDYANEFPKIECLPTEKALDGKCRLVCGTDADTCIAVKMYFAWFNRLLKSCGFHSGILIGQNPNGYDSHIMALALMLWNNIDDMDVSGWDTSFFRYLMLAARDVALAVSRCDNEEDILAMHTIVESMMYVVHVAHIRYVKGEFVSYAVFYEWFHGMISGSYLTLLWNSTGNAILARYMLLCGYVMTHKGVDYLCYDPEIHGAIDIEELEDFIHYATGDDSLSSKSEALSWYTADLRTALYARHGVKCTPSDKDGVFTTKSLKPYDQIPAPFSFCKRYPRFCIEANRWVWVLDRASMNCSIYYSENFREKEQVIDDYFKQLALYGRKVFNKDAPVLDKAVTKLYDYKSTFSNYELALAAALSEVDMKLAARIKVVIDAGIIPPEYIPGLINRANLATFLGSQEVVGSPDKSVNVNVVSEEFKENYEEMIDSDSLMENPADSPSGVVNSNPDNKILAFSETDATFKFDNIAENTEVVGETEPTEEFSDIYSKTSDFFKRPALIQRVTLTTAQTTNTDVYSFDIGPQLNTVKLWDEKVNGYAGCLGTAVVTVVLNATNMQKGAWLLRYIPCYAHNATASSMNVTLMQKSQHPGIMFTTDALSGDAIQLKIPYVAPSSYYKFSTGKYDWGRVFLTVMSPLKNSPTATSVTVDATIFLHFEDFKLVVPTVLALSESVDISTMPVSKALAKTAKVLHKLSDIPPLSAYVKPVAWVADGASKVAAAMGYSKPQNNNNILYTVDGSNRYAITSDGPDLSLSTSLSTLNSVRTITHITPRKEDEMSFNFIKRHWSYFKTDTWTTSQTPGTEVMSISIAPGAFYSTVAKTAGGKTLTSKNYAPFAHISTLFASWRGSIEVKLRVISTVETGRLKIMYTPSPDTVTGTDMDMTVMTVVMDLSKEKEITFTVPYLSQYHYLGPFDVAGTITVRVLNTLRTPETVSPDVEILSFVRAGEDYEVNGPVPLTNVYPIVAMSDTEIVFGDQMRKDLRTKYAEESIGEMFMSVKQLLMRITYMRSLNAATYWGLNVNLDYIESIFLNAGGTLDGPTWGCGYFPHIISMYAFRRGSHAVTTNYSNAFLALRDTNVVTYRTSTTWPTVARDWKVNSVTPPIAQAANAIGRNIRVPYMCDTPFTINRLQMGDVAYTDSDEPWSAIEFTNNTAVAPTISKVYCDDYQLGFFICTPLVMTTFV